MIESLKASSEQAATLKPFVKEISRYALSNGISDVITALSGGSDSCCLLSLLNLSGLNIQALHCNFNLRGEESLRDRDYVKTLCDKMNIPLEIKEFDVKKYVGNKKRISIEMACRELRYEWFSQKMQESGAQRLCIGHNADDNIETFFLNLLRGSGTRGLKGMDYDTGYIWRPLLKIHKKNILELLEILGIDYVTDSSNLKNDYRRNLLRNTIIPLFKKEWKGFDTALDKSLSFLHSENLIIEKSLSDILESFPEGLPADVVLSFPDSILLIQRYIEAAGPYKDTAVEIYNALLAEKPKIPVWNLKFGKVEIRKHILKIYC